MKRKKSAPLSTPRQRSWIVGGLTDELVRLVQIVSHTKKISSKSLRVDFEVSSTHSLLSSNLLRLQKILDMTTREIQEGELNMCEQELSRTAQSLYLYMKAQSNEKNELDTTITLLSNGIDKGYETTRKYLNILIEAGYITRIPYQVPNKTRYIIERRS